MIPKYILLRDRLKEEIIAKKYPLFSKLPTEMEMTKLYSVSRCTLRQALALLEEEGIIEKKWGSANTVISAGITSFKDTVALLLPDDTQHQYIAIKEDCTTALYRENLKVKLFPTKEMLDAERAALDEILHNSYAGIIARPVKSALPSTNSDLYRQALRQRLPLIFIYGTPKDMDLATSVVMEDYSAGYTLARHLINKGHKVIGGVFKDDEMESILRYSGYANALRDVGYTIPEDHIYWYSSRDVKSGEEPSECIDRIITERIQEVSGMVCYNDQIACLLTEKIKKLGLSVPEDIAVTGVGDDHYATASMPNLTTLSPSRSIGREAASLLISHRKGVSISSVPIPWKIIQREST